MKNSYLIKTGKQDLLLYFVLIAFLYPRGFSEYIPVYKIFFTIWTWTAVTIIWLQYILLWKTTIIKFNINYFIFSIYFILSILITLFIRGNMSSGIQQMIAYPSLCIFIIINFKKNSQKILNSISNIMIILFIFNLLVFRGYFADKYHITFLGHVQIMSQIGIVSIFTCILNYMLEKRYKIKMLLLLLLTITNMLVTDADSAVISAIIIILAGILYKLKLCHILCINPKWYILGMFVLNIFIIYITAIDNVLKKYIPVITLSGRNFVWRDALSKIEQYPILGYGIDGVWLQTFWTEPREGFNYAHNQIMQNLLDGGIVLCVAFWSMIMISVMKKLDDKRYQVLSNIILIILLFIMIFDSTSLYSYMYIFLTLMLELPKVLSVCENT